MTVAWFAAVPKLMDSLLHDSRNPLNAMALNVEVLSEKLRSLPSPVPGADRNLRAIRDQVFRVDSTLRRFADFIAPRQGGEREVNFSELMESAVEILAHEVRTRRLRITSRVEPGLRVKMSDAAAGNFLALQAVLRSIQKAEPEGEIDVSLVREGQSAVLKVIDPVGREDVSLAAKEDADVVPLLEAICARNGGSASVRGRECLIALPLYQP